MGRKHKRKTERTSLLPAAEALVGPTPEQMTHATYERGEIVHAESFTRATVHRVRQVSSLVRLYENGTITADQLNAAHRISVIAEMIERQVGYRSPSYSAQVDNSGSGRDVLVEYVGRVRDEMAYTEWSKRLPMPRRLSLDLVLGIRPIAATARVYRMRYAKAQERLIDALDLWLRLRAEYARKVDEDDIAKAHARLCA